MDQVEQTDPKETMASEEVMDREVLTQMFSHLQIVRHLPQHLETRLQAEAECGHAEDKV
jgi:hypothetical protein